MSTVNVLSDFLGKNFFDQDVSKLFRIHTGYDNHLFSAEGTRISIFRVLGALKPQDGAQRTEALERFEKLLNHFAKTPGHRITLVYQQNTDGVESYLKAGHEGIRISLDRIGMSALEGILSSREDNLRSKLTLESAYLVVETLWSAIRKDQIKEAKPWRLFATGSESQSGRISSALDDAHESMVNLWSKILKQDLNIRLNRLTARQAAAEISSLWKGIKISPKSIRLPGDPPVMRGWADNLDLQRPKIDHKALLLPSLKDQLFDTPVYFEGGRDDSCRIGSRHYGAVRLGSMPGFETSFNHLITAIPRDIPLRLAIQFDSGKGDASELGFRRAIAMMNVVSNPFFNTKVRASIDHIKELVELGVRFLPCRFVMTTWGATEEAMNSNLSVIESAFGSFGGTRAERIVESIDDAVAQTLPGSVVKGANLYFPSQVLAPILPVERVESPWQQASMLARTEDKKAYPIELGSALMDFHTYVIVGPPGTGKSATMTTQLLNGTILKSGIDKLPLVRYIDIGYTSAGPFYYYQSLLPQSRKHEIVHFQLENSRHQSINILDTPLGCDYPPATELDAICQFVELLVQDENGSLPRLVPELIRLLVQEAYRMVSEVNPKLYSQGLDDYIDRAIKREGIEINPKTTWKTLRDQFFDEGRLYEAELCHLQAVPFWMELSTFLADSAKIRSQFSGLTLDDGTTEVISYLITKIESQSRQYSNLGGASNLNFTSARMIGVDLQNVATSVRATEVYYMMARFLMMKGWSMDMESVSTIPNLSERYLKYHRDQIRVIRNTEKWMFYDELHRVTMNADDSRVIKSLMRDNREIRKNKGRLILASQSINHMPSELKEDSMWTMLIIQGARGKEQRQKLKDLFGLTDYGMIALEERVNGPVPGVGATVLMLAETKIGRIEQTLVISPSAVELWAAPSSAENANLCKELIDVLGDPEEAVRRLAATFKTGDCTQEIRKRMEEAGGTLTENQVMRQLVDELSHQSS